MLAEWTNPDTIRLAGRMALFGWLVIAITTAGTWAAEWWGGEEGGL